MAKLEAIKKARRERSSMIFYLHGHGMSFRDIGKMLGQVQDSTKAMGIAHVYGLYKGEVRRRARLAKAHKRAGQSQSAYYQGGMIEAPGSLNGKGVDAMEKLYHTDTIKDKVKAEIDLRKSLDSAPVSLQERIPNKTWNSGRYLKDKDQDNGC